MKRIETICQVCGGPLGVSLDGKTVRCPYCESVFFIDDPDYIKMQSAAAAEKKVMRQRESLADFVDRSCDEIMETEPEAFRDRENIRIGLGVQDEKVYLIHDDTALGSGKYGFAVTDRGFFCREPFSQTVEFTSWEKIRAGRRVRGEGYFLTQGETHLAYFTSVSEKTRELLRRFGTDLQQKLKEGQLN